MILAGDVGGTKVHLALYDFEAGRLKLTNLPWTLDTRELRVSIGIEHIFLINDLEANGYGIPELAPDKVYTLLAGDASAVGHQGLVSAGTGLG